MLPKYQQNLDTLKDYIKSHDLRIRCSAITARYSTSDEKSVLRFMVLASVLENDSFAFSKFSRHVANGDKLEARVRRFVHEVALDVSELPRVSATVDSSGDMLVKLKILKRSAIGSRQSGSISISRLVDPRLMSDKVIRKKVSDLAKLVVQTHKYFASYVTRSRSYFDDVAKELNYLLTSATYRTGFKSMQQKVRSLLHAG